MIRPSKSKGVTKTLDDVSSSLVDEIVSSKVDKIREEPEDVVDEEDNDDDILEEPKSINKYLIIGCIVGGVILLTLVIVLILNNKPKPVVQEDIKPTVDINAVEKQKLYEAGIGKEYINELKIYEQGNLENLTFRKDFLSEGQPEMFLKPIRIQIVKDSISYKKHRSQTGDGVEIYWLEGKYKGRNCVLTIPYSIYQSITDEGTIDVNVEVVTDKNNSQTITNFSAIAPQKSK